MGIPATDDLNDLDEAQGVSPSPVNIDDGVRFNTAFAYLDPVREPAEPDDRRRRHGRPADWSTAGASRAPR